MPVSKPSRVTSKVKRAKPHPKVAAGAAAGVAGVPLILWLAKLAGVEMDQVVAAEIAGVAAFVAGWLKSS